MKSVIRVDESVHVNGKYHKKKNVERLGIKLEVKVEKNGTVSGWTLGLLWMLQSA